MPKKSNIPILFIIANLLLYGSFSIAVIYGNFYIGLLGTFLAAIIITNIETFKSYIGISIVMVLCLQNFIVGAFGKLGGQFSSLSFMTQIPFLFLAFIFLSLFIQEKIKIDKLYKPMFLLALIILFAVINGGGISNILVQVRNLIVFFLAFEVFSYCGNNEYDFKIFSNQFLSLGVFMFIIALILYIGGFSLYEKLGIANVYTAKGLPGEGVYFLPPRFTTEIFNIPITRMGGLYYEPVTLSYFFSAEFIGAIILPWTKDLSKKLVLSMVFGVALLLTGGKGGMLISVALIFAYICTKIGSSNISPIKIWFILVFTVSIFTLFSKFYASNYAGPAGAHFTTITDTWSVIKQSPLGHGLAQGGFNDNELSFDNQMATGAESALMSIGYQLGIPGMGILGLAFVTMTNQVMGFSYRVNRLSNSYYYMIAFIPIVLFGSSVFQLNTFTPQAIVPFMALLSGAFTTPNNSQIKGLSNMNVQKYKF